MLRAAQARALARRALARRSRPPARGRARCWSSPTNFSTPSGPPAVATGDGWRELSSTVEDGASAAAGRGPAATRTGRGAPPGRSSRPRRPRSRSRGALARRLAAQGGAALIVDYGHDRPARATRCRRSRRMPMPIPGRRRASATSPPMSISRRLPRPRARGRARVFGPVGRRATGSTRWGSTLRAAALARAAPERAEEIDAARDRLSRRSRWGGCSR